MKCEGLIGRLLGHSFQPRYNTGASTLELGTIKTSAHAALELAEKYRPHSYRGDICTRCGTYIDRSH